MPASCGRWDAAERRQRPLALVPALAARLAFEAQAFQAGDLAFPFHSCRMPGGEGRDQLRDAFAQLQREVRGGGAHQLAYILHRHLVTWLRADRVLGLAHFFGSGNEVVGVLFTVLVGVAAVVVSVLVGGLGVGVVTLVLVDVEDELLGAISSIPSNSACVLAPIALSSPISQP